MEAKVLEWIYKLIIAGCLGYLIWQIKSIKSYVDAKIADMEKSYHSCREELPHKYAGKKKTCTGFGNLWAQVDKNSVSIARMEGAKERG